ncbi:MAG: ACP S-malonyltransferase [Deltaproteobacteria bacterium]|nr:ACP S-malonyltransferase [Deltaproteobacteria bacterium]MBW2192421.1 ACP S-malonyltransferase [Deltaproteobacteria bacterium]
MTKTAFLFPGQGSQAVGMGHDVYQEYGFVRELFDMAEEIARVNISRLCFKGPIEDLTMTVNLQPAITAVNLAFLSAIENEGVRSDISAGHSLGEFSALCSAGVISKEDTFRLVFERGSLMHRESTRYKGSMYAIIGLSLDAVQDLVAKVRKEGVVSVANHNTEQQIVITGAPDPVEKVASLAASQGAKSIPLKVSGAWHSELIKNAQDEFKDFLDPISFSTPERSVILNVTADFASDPDEIKTFMGKQLCSPVKWYDAMCRLVSENVENFVEIGNGKVLTGLLKKILPKDYPCNIYNVNSMKHLEKLLKERT